jgi:hypothetical protein
VPVARPSDALVVSISSIEDDVAAQMLYGAHSEEWVVQISGSSETFHHGRFVALAHDCRAKTMCRQMISECVRRVFQGVT